MKKTIYLLVFFLTAFPLTMFAHPSPIDFGLFHRHDIGVVLAIVALVFSVLFYTVTGLKKSNRAVTVNDYFFYDKKATLGQYFDTTVGYSFQVVVTIFFIYWGFNYGIWILAYAITWVLGFYLFQLFSPKLIEFMAMNETLHGFLSTKLNFAVIKKITACLTIFGLLGGLIIEVSYTTDIIKWLSLDKIDDTSWIIIFALILFITWYYVQYGGFKATVNIATYQLPIIYFCLSIIFSYLIWLCFHNGDNKHGLYVALFLIASWLTVYFARRKTLKKTARTDLATLSALFGLIVTSATTLILCFHYGIENKPVDTIADLPNSFSFIDGFKFQDKIVFIGFAILNISWQFFDMSAWQRLSSIDLTGLDEIQKKQRVRSAIGETKFESPVTWLFGILFGIALHHSGIFNSSTQAYDAFGIFIKTLSDNDFDKVLGMSGTYIVLPLIIVAFFGIALSTTDSFLNSITYSWISDLSKSKLNKFELEKDLQESTLIKKANKVALLFLIIGAIVFIIVSRIIKVDIFVILNTIYSAQFLICFFTFTALLVKSPKTMGKWVTTSVIIALVANFATAVFCYYQMKNNTQEAYWSDWFYVLPTIVCTIIGLALILPVAIFKRKTIA